MGMASSQSTSSGFAIPFWFGKLPALALARAELFRLVGPLWSFERGRASSVCSLSRRFRFLADIPERLNRDAAKDGDTEETMGKFLRKEEHEGMAREEEEIGEEEEGGDCDEA